MSLWGDEESSLQMGDGVADPFMKLTSPPEQTTMVGGSETESAANWFVRSVYCNWKPHAILRTHADQLVFLLFLA